MILSNNQTFSAWIYEQIIWLFPVTIDEFGDSKMTEICNLFKFYICTMYIDIWHIGIYKGCRQLFYFFLDINLEPSNSMLF